MKRLSILLFCALFSMVLKADHMMGSDIEYICISPGKYKIITKIYRQCAGIPLNFGSISMYCGNTSFVVNVKRTSIKDITPTCASGSAPCNPQNQMSNQGVEEHTFECIIDFNSSPYNTFKQNNCCKVYFAATQCCRDELITTQPYDNFYTESMLDICNIKGKCNNSPQLTTPPISYICCNQPFSFNNGVTDKVDGDSLAYSLGDALKAKGQNILKNGSFTAQIPMTPFCLPPGVVNCKPLPNAKPPRGFYFDNSTGDIIFMPTKCDEAGPVVIQIDEYRKDSTGAWVNVGTTRRDMMMIVVKCADNNPPQITNNSNKYTVCEGNKICFVIKTVDNLAPNQKVADSTYLSWNYGIPGATFRIIDPTAREKQAEFCWQTKIGDARTNSYNFTAVVKDDNCPRPATTAKGFLIAVKAKAQAKRVYEILDCGKLRFTSYPLDTVNYKGSYNYEWAIRDSTNSGLPYYKSYQKRDSFKFIRGGKYIITHTINNLPINCPTIYTDTVIMPPIFSVELAFGKDTFVCAGDSIKIKPIIANGVPNFKLHWESPLGTFKAKDTLEYYILKPKANTTVMLKITDKNKCVDGDTIKVKYQPNPVVNIGPDKRICTYQSVTLDAQNADTLRYYWLPDGDSTRFKTINIAGQYIAKVIDILGCNTSDTMNLAVNDTVVAIAKPDREICIQDTLKVKASRRPLGYSRSMVWTDLNTGIVMANDSSFKTKIIQQADRKYDLFLKVTQSGVTCIDHDTLLIVVNPLPTFSFAGLPPRCFTDGAVNLTQKQIAIAKDQSGAKFTDIRYYQKFKKPSWVTGGPVGSSPYIYNYPLFIKNEQVPQAGLKDTICYDYRDFKGCYFSECKPIRLNPNPLVHMKNGIFCQKAGPINLERLVDTPFVKTGGIQTYRVLSVPPSSGVDPAALITEDKTYIPSKYWMDPGLEGENNKTGDYTVEYCFKNPSTSCQKCDTARITVVRLPEIQFDPIPSQCINYPYLALDSFVVEKNSGRRFPDGYWKCIAFGGSRDKTLPAVNNAINNAVKLQKKFDPSTGSGQYQLRFTDTSSGCMVTDSTDINVNGLPQIKLAAPDTVCSTSGIFQLKTNYPDNDPNSSWYGPFVKGSTFDPSKGPGAQQYEGPYKLVFKYTNPLTKCSDTGINYKTIQTQPEITITNTDPYTLCENDTFKLISTSKFVTKGIVWSTSGDGTFLKGTKLPNTTYYQGTQDTIAGEAILTITSNKEGVCPQVKDDLRVLLEPYPVWSMPMHFVQCEPGLIDFSTFVTQPTDLSKLRYDWYYGNGDSILNSTDGSPVGIKYPISKQGWYDVKLTVHNQWGALPTESCAVTKDSLGYVRIIPTPKAGFTSDPGFFTTVAFPKFKFFNNSKVTWGAMTHEWNFDNLKNPDDTSTQENPIHTYPTDTTTYYVYLKSSFTYPQSADPKVLTEDFVCWDSISQLRKIGPDVTVFVPTAFSPEGTGPKLNNTFYAVVNGEKTFHIEVFNRWGELLWETDNKYETWNGRYRDGDCQQDVYAWVVKVTAYDGEEYRYEGTVTLLR